MFGKKKDPRTSKEAIEKRIESRLGKVKKAAGKEVNEDTKTMVKDLARSDN